MNNLEEITTLPPTVEEIVLARRSSIVRLQDAMLDSDEQLSIDDDFPLKHYFAPGVYAREILLPKDTLVVGKIHKHAHVNIISTGKVRVATESGDEEFTAPYTFISQPGTKRAVVALEDTIWTTIHLTDKTDLLEVEAEIIAPTFEDYFKFVEDQSQHLLNKKD